MGHHRPCVRTQVQRKLTETTEQWCRRSHISLLPHTPPAVHSTRVWLGTPQAPAGSLL